MPKGDSFPRKRVTLWIIRGFWGVAGAPRTRVQKTGGRELSYFSTPVELL